VEIFGRDSDPDDGPVKIGASDVGPIGDVVEQHLAAIETKMAKGVALGALERQAAHLLEVGKRDDARKLLGAPRRAETDNLGAGRVTPLGSRVV
jgi:hypothetical protein